jgi:hypothetical protein
MAKKTTTTVIFSNDDKHASKEADLCHSPERHCRGSIIDFKRCREFESQPELSSALGHLKLMTLLLDAGADIDDVDEYHSNACRIALSNDHFDALKLLVERGANLSVVDSDGRSVLANVARLNRSERYVTLLLDAGASLDGLSHDNLCRC